MTRQTEPGRRRPTEQHERLTSGEAPAEHAETVGVIAYGAERRNGESRS